MQGALANLGHKLAGNTIANILKRHGIAPAPERSRRKTWKDFLRRHLDQIVATDFFTAEVWTCSGLQRFIVLFFMDLSTRRVELGGIAACANGLWMSQIARNLTSSPCLADTTNHEKEPEMAGLLDRVRPRHLAAWRSSFAWSGCGDSQPDN